MDISTYTSCTNSAEYESRTIIFFNTDLECNNNNDSFLFMARMARQLGHKIIVITSYCEYIEKLASLIIYQVGGFIPRTIFRRFYKTLYFFRTIYLVIWLLRNVQYLNPTFVIVQNTTLILPILKIIGNLHIVLVHKLPDGEMIEWINNMPKSKKKILHKFLIKHADEIVVTNKLEKSVYDDLFIGTGHNVSILYPCMDFREFKKCSVTELKELVKLPNTSLLFSCFGPLEPTSNFELAIRAYVILLNEIYISDPYLFTRLNLLIISEKTSEKYDDYFYNLNLFALQLCHNKPSIYFLESNEMKARKTIITNSIAVLFPMLNNFDGQYILEASLMKVPVLAAQSEIANELIIDGINGFRLESHPYVFANCMHSLITSKIRRSLKRPSIYNSIIDQYTISKYNLKLEDIVNRNSGHVQNDNTEIQE